MTWWQAALLGALGAAVVTGIDVFNELRLPGGDPSRFLRPNYVVAECLRLTVGAVLAAITNVGPFAPFAVGIGGPLLAQQLIRSFLASPASEDVER